MTPRKQRGASKYPAERQRAAEVALDFVDKGCMCKKQRVDDEFLTAYNLRNANFRNDMHLIQWAKHLKEMHVSEVVVAMTSDNKLCVALHQNGVQHCKFDWIYNIFNNYDQRRAHPRTWATLGPKP